MTPTKRILIMGGGVGGIVAAHNLRKRLPQSKLWEPLKTREIDQR